ncbi:apolipoprotein A [Acrasis kona]|uniref:Apolipoprotein A n=1 Tax=Acrasis kona TaxID=1008807 RepID=A0AAW2YY41_9EUKA
MTQSDNIRSKAMPIAIQESSKDTKKTVKRKEKLLAELDNIRSDNAAIEAMIADEIKKRAALTKSFEEAKKNLIMLQYNLRKTNSKCQRLKKDLHMQKEASSS